MEKSGGGGGVAGVVVAVVVVVAVGATSPHLLPSSCCGFHHLPIACKEEAQQMPRVVDVGREGVAVGGVQDGEEEGDERLVQPHTSLGNGQQPQHLLGVHSFPQEIGDEGQHVTPPGGSGWGEVWGGGGGWGEWGGLQHFGAVCLWRSLRHIVRFIWWWVIG